MLIIRAIGCCSTLCSILYGPKDCSPPGISVHGDFPGKNTGVGAFPSPGIFLTQELDPCLLHWQADSSSLSHQGSPITNETPLFSCQSLFSLESDLFCMQANHKTVYLEKNEIEFLYTSFIVWFLVVPKVLFSLVYAPKFLQNSCWQELAYFEKDDCDVFNCLNLLSWGDWRNWKHVFLQSRFLYLDAYCLTVFAEDT